VGGNSAKTSGSFSRDVLKIFSTKSKFQTIGCRAVGQPASAAIAFTLFYPPTFFFLVPTLRTWVGLTAFYFFQGKKTSFVEKLLILRLEEKNSVTFWSELEKMQ
jgi:hypothetical protein